MQCFTRHRNPDRRLRDDLAIDGNVLLRDGVDYQFRDPYDLYVGGAEGHAQRNPCPLFCQYPLRRPLENADDNLAVVGVRLAVRPGHHPGTRRSQSERRMPGTRSADH